MDNSITTDALNTPKRPILTNLQLLRAFAALSVVLFHSVENTAAFGHPAVYLQWLNGWGQSGVDIFFVISGFVIVATQSANPKGAIPFITRRFARIVPLYWIVTTAYMAVKNLVSCHFQITPRTH